MENEENLEQAEILTEDKQEIAPEVNIETLQKSYRELQSAFTKKSQALKELEQKVNSIPSRENIIREYLLGRNAGMTPPVLVSSSSAFDFAKEKKPVTLAQAEKLAREFFSGARRAGE